MGVGVNAPAPETRFVIIRDRYGVGLVMATGDKREGLGEFPDMEAARRKVGELGGKRYEFIDNRPRWQRGRWWK